MWGVDIGVGVWGRCVWVFFLVRWWCIGGGAMLR